MTDAGHEEQDAADEAAYAGRHPGDPDARDPGFCRCGLGLDAWVHTDTKRYREVPLGAARRWGDGS